MRLTRADTEFIGGEEEDDNHACKITLNTIVEALDVAVATASAEVHAEKEGKARRAMIKLTSDQRARRFLGDGATLPLDDKLCVCARCGHRGTVDEPRGNVDKRRRNAEKMLEWQEAKEEYKRARETGSSERVGFRGSVVTRAPPKPVYEAVPIVCHCKQMWNPKPGSPEFVGST